MNSKLESGTLRLSDIQSDITFTMESGDDCGMLIFDADTKKFRFEGDAEESAKVFLKYLQDKFNILNKKNKL